MDYILSAIADYLVDEGFNEGSILIDYSTETTDTDFDNKERIVLMSQAGNSQGYNTPTQMFNFTVYVRKNKRSEARQLALDVYNALQNAMFQSDNGVTVHQITGNPPYFWGMIPQKVNMNEFAINMTAMFNNNDARL